MSIAFCHERARGEENQLPGSIAGGIREKKRPAGTLALAPGSMVVLPARARWLLDFHARMRAIQRRGDFMERAIRQKNDADALYTLYSGNAL